MCYVALDKKDIRNRKVLAVARKSQSMTLYISIEYTTCVHGNGKKFLNSQKAELLGIVKMF